MGMSLVPCKSAQEVTWLEWEGLAQWGRGGGGVKGAGIQGTSQSSVNSFIPSGTAVSGGGRWRVGAVGATVSKGPLRPLLRGKEKSQGPVRSGDNPERDNAGLVGGSGEGCGK